MLFRSVTGVQTCALPICLLLVIVIDYFAEIIVIKINIKKLILFDIFCFMEVIDENIRRHS